MLSFLLDASIDIALLQQNFEIALNWLGKFIRIIIEGVGGVGIGVIVFTLVLKAITTPFDIYQRVSMRKQTLVMRNMQSELEKLQKQYANDKNTYSQKMMELQKKNGYSMLGACLPMIISLVILIVAVTSFQSYSQYANLSMYQSMAKSYNAAILEYAPDAQDSSTITREDYEEGGIQRVRVTSSAATSYIYYTYAKDDETGRRNYTIDLDKFRANQSAESKAFVTEYIAQKAEEGITVTEDEGCREWFRNEGAKAAAEEFRNLSNPGFLWIKNVWYPDVSYQHPIQSYNSFTSSISSKITDDYGNTKAKIGDIFDEESYNSLTRHLDEEKSTPNGYFILIVLTIGLMVLSQFIMMKSQKEQSQFQTVDGQGAQTQKIMMIVMPLIYAITGFLWTAAFSIYIAVSSIFGIVISLLTNLILGRIFNKKEEEALKARYTRTVPWKKPEDKDNKRKK